MIDTDKYEGHTPAPWKWKQEMTKIPTSSCFDNDIKADENLIADAPLLLEFIQKVVKDWCKPNQCNQAFGKDVRQLMYEYGLITFNEETRRYEVKE